MDWVTLFRSAAVAALAGAVFHSICRQKEMMIGVRRLSMAERIEESLEESPGDTCTTTYTSLPV